jgi:DNA-binding NarL/FixJ family response regulator/Flp pilus assembly protein TadD
MTCDLTAKTVLVIDDIPMMRSAIKTMMLALNVKEVDMSPNAADAIRRISAKTYDIILCDYYLGDGKNGQQILEETKLLGLLRSTTLFIMITAEKARQQVMSVIEYNPDAYVIKPFNKDTLSYHIEKVIEKRKHFDDINRAIDNKDLTLAIRLCDKKVRENPQNALEYFRIKSSLFIETNQYDEARAIFETFLSKRDILWAKMGMGKIHYLTQDYLQAKNVFQEIVEQNSTLVEAYDWLVKTLLAMGNPVEAQHILELATRLAPSVVTRKRNLAELSYKNDDIDLATQTFKELIQLSKDSIHKSLSDYITLSEALNRRGKGSESLAVLKNARLNFKAEPESLLRIALANALTFNKEGKTGETQNNFKEARKQYDLLSGKITPETTLELIRASLMLGETDCARTVAEAAAKRYYNNSGLLAQISELFARFDQETAFDDIVTAAKEDIAIVNRRGVQLFEQNNYEEAIALFEQASAEQPDNVTFSLNTAQALIVYMQKKGATNDLLFRARQHLEKGAVGMDTDDRYHRLVDMLKALKG